ncbi:NUDIX domain-containing protein [Albidovulum inexpectatum]|uniref:NUDIX domain-containing protein n=1 Tax=Albidovulum inexpectatum TaxID=196587 RepID=UPI0014758E42|nr:NUDIX domain-containing protein [Albidovulum inexpectatum]
MTIPVFLYGTLCHLPLLRVVLGRDPQWRAARLPGHRVLAVEGESFPILVEGNGIARGILLEGLDRADRDRLDFFERGFGYAPHATLVETEGGDRVQAMVYRPQPGRWRAGDPWRLGDWVRKWGDVTTLAAQEAMALYQAGQGDRMAQRWPMMLMRAGAAVRARKSEAPATLRRPCAPGDIVVDHWSQPYANYFAVEENDLRFRRFDGGMSPVVNRAAFVSGDAVVVLPFDPVRDRVLLVEQVRMGAHGRGDPQPWLIETVAGRVDGGETPEEAARREAREEARLELRDVLPVLECYPSPGAMTEYLYLFVALTDLPDTAAGIAGADDEHEDIRVHVVTFERMMHLIETGEINTAPLILLAQWLSRERERLRAADS